MQLKKTGNCKTGLINTCLAIFLGVLSSQALVNAETSGPKKVVQNKVNVYLRNTHPVQYTVKKGDTLWDISSKFLQNPWIWPQIWDANPQIENPHLIYPGDIISLVYVNGEPRLHVERPGSVPTSVASESTPGDRSTAHTAETTGVEVTETLTEELTEDGLKIVKLSPQIRYEEQDQAIETVEASTIQTFLAHPKILSSEEYEGLPYIVGNYEGRVISATGDEVYARGMPNTTNEYRYSVYRKGEIFKDPENGDILGYEAIYAADARVVKFGDPSTLFITEANREVIAGDRLITSDRSDINHNIIPSVSEIDFEGRIIGLFDAISQTARNQVVAINLGKRDGIVIGNVLSINRYGGKITDQLDLDEDGLPINVRIPDVRSGILMVFKVFERISYGLIMESKRVIRNGDAVSTPK